MSDLLRLTALTAPHWRWMALGVLLSLVSILANVTLMAVSGWFIAAMAIAGAAGASMDYYSPAATIRAMAIARTTSRYAERLVTHEATFRLISRLRVWFYERLEPLAPAALASERAGDVFSRLRADVDALERFYLGALLPAVTGALAAFGFVVFLALRDVGLALVELALLAGAGVGVPALVHALARKASARAAALASELRASLAEASQGLGELQLYAAEARAFDQAAALSERLTAEQRRLRRLHSLAGAAVGLAGHLALWSAIALIAPRVADETIAPADLAMLALFALASFEAIAAAPDAALALAEASAAARRVFALADRAPVIEEPAAPAAPAAPATAPNVRVRDLAFAYAADAPAVLEGLDLDLAPGRKVALVGATGAGKSSVVQALARFYPPRAGAITLDETPVEAFAGDDVRALFAVASQSTYVFNASLGDNLRVARPDATEAMLDEACAVSGFDAVIAAREKGYDALAGQGGAALSGGERRRLGLARALLKPAPYLVLDEPGEGLDPETERQVITNILKALGERGLVLITHSPAGLAAMDEVVLLDAGRVIARGTHAALLERSDYRELFARLGSLPRSRI